MEETTSQNTGLLFEGTTTQAESKATSSNLFSANDYAEMYEDTTEKEEVKSTPSKPNKKLVQPEVKYGALVDGNDLVYAVHIKAQISQGGGLFGGFGSSLVASDKSVKSEVQCIDTILMAKVKKTATETTVEVNEISPSDNLYLWFTGDKTAKYTLPTYIAEDLKNIVGNAMAQFKGSLVNFAPLTSETLVLIQADPVISSALEDLKEASIQLSDVVQEAKKLGGNLGLDGFIERYAFNNHVLLAGPRGVKFLHDTIAA